jgi:peptidoglycan biosynthesis protein MviN/MurJ (putative lipid II flippase)
MSERVRSTSILFTEILIWVLPFNALITLLILALNAHNRFALAAAVYPINTLFFVRLAFRLRGWLDRSSLFHF